MRGTNHTLVLLFITHLSYIRAEGQEGKSGESHQKTQENHRPVIALERLLQPLTEYTPNGGKTCTSEFEGGSRRSTPHGNDWIGGIQRSNDLVSDIGGGP